MFTSKVSMMQEKIELLEFSLGSSPPCLGLRGTRWSSSGDQVCYWFFKLVLSNESKSICVALVTRMFGKGDKYQSFLAIF